jgi:hypothetical protein
MPSVQQLSAGKADPFAGEMAQQISQMSSSVANMIRGIRANQQAKRQNEVLGKFIEYTSIGMPTEQALAKTVQQFMPLGLPGMAGMPTPLQVPTGEVEQPRTILDPASALTMISKENGGKNEKYTSILNPTVAKAVIENAYGQTRQRSNKFETFVGEDGKTHKGVFDNEGNMVKDMGIAPATYGGKAQKSADEKLYEKFSKELESNPIVEKDNDGNLVGATKRQLWLQSQIDKYGAKINSELGGESYTNPPIDDDAPALARSFLDKEFGKLSQDTKRTWLDDTYSPENTKAAIENATQSLMKEGDYSEKDARRVVLETYQGLKKNDKGRLRVFPDGIGGDIEKADNIETAVDSNDTNGVSVKNKAGQSPKGLEGLWETMTDEEKQTAVSAIKNGISIEKIKALLK